MTNNTHKTAVDALAAKIGHHLQNGIDLDAETEARVTELSGRPIERLSSLLSDADDNDAVLVISLLMTPDIHLQTALEPLLWRFTVTPTEEKALVEKLVQKPPVIEIRPSNHSPAARWSPPGWGLSELIARLYLTWPINPNLFPLADQQLRANEKLRFRVALRNARVDLAPSVTECFKKFICNRKRFENAFFEHLDLLLTAWGGSAAHAEPLKPLARLKGSYIKALRQNHRFEKASRNHNMETLLLQGIPTPAIGVETALRHIGMIDNLTLTLFGQIVSVDDRPETVPPTQNPV